MANTGVQGKIVGEDGVTGIADLTVEAYDVDPPTRDVKLGESKKTSGTGDFSISYGSGKYGFGGPTLRIRVRDSVMRLVYESPPIGHVSAEVFPMGSIRVPAADRDGWLVTLLTGKAQMLRQGSNVEILIDNKAAWQRVTDAINGATASVEMTQLIFDVGNLFTVFATEINPGVTTSTRLENTLLSANKRYVGTTRVAVRILLNEIAVVWGDLDYLANLAGSSVLQTKAFFKKEQNHTVEVRSLTTAYNNAMHSKCLIVDGTVAYLIASPMLQEYFDDVQHKICDPRRGKMSFPTNVIKVPVHDVSAVVRGPSVEDLRKTFALLWRASGGTLTDPATVKKLEGDSCSVQVVRTLPADRFKTGTEAVPAVTNGELGILEAYLRAIRKAEHFIYIENQYITVEVILTALLLALGKNTNLQLIVLGNNAVDAPGYNARQKKFFLKLLKDFPKQVGVFTLWSHEEAGGKHKIIRNYVHSKVAIVDDKWATIGSANLDGQGLILSHHLANPITQADVRQERAIETNIVVYNDVDGQPASAVPDKLRRLLWAEHLGCPVDDDKLRYRPGSDFIRTWNDAAAAKLRGLTQTPPTRHEARVLWWNDREEDPREFLSQSGVPQSNLSVLNVMKEVADYDFSKGQWKGSTCK